MIASFGIGVVAFVLAAICAVVDWAAVIRRWKRVEYVCKPATMVALIAAALCLTAGRGGVAFRAAFLLGLTFSLLGDVALMLPGEWGFLPGLVAFLLGHLSYLTGFNLVLPPRSALILLPVIALLAVFILKRLIDGLVAHGADHLRIPIIAYGGVLSLTLASGWSTLFRPSWSPPARIAAVLGVTLFFASDLMLAWDRFVRRSHLLHVLVIITYHLAQFALTVTLLLAV
jgi:uncharacterized membrane protein YhhN